MADRPAMLKVGDAAPSFRGVDASGGTVSLDDYRGRPVVVYFYPRAGTSGCTMETNDFVRHYGEIQRAGIALLGVSVDPVEAQRRFAESCAVPFPLIADADRTIARQYGVLGVFGVAKRVTFWIGPDGRIEEVVAGMLPGPHVRAVLERMSRAPGSSAAASPRPTRPGD